jgi:hypothetical protein
MEQIQLNNEYIRKNSSTGEIFIPISINGNIVRFKNDAQCPVDTFIDTFVLKSSINESNNFESASSPNLDLDNQDDLLKLFSDPTAIQTGSSILNQLDDVLSGKQVNRTVRSEASSSYMKDEDGSQINKKVYNDNSSEYNPNDPDDQSNLPEHRRKMNSRLNKT